jgi:hypothetical protein
MIIINLENEILPLTLSTFNNDKRPISSGKCVKQFERNERILKLEQLPIYLNDKFNDILLKLIFLHLLVLIEFDYDLM